MYQKIILCGFRAVGKTTTGKYLTSKLTGCSFIDLDTQIAKEVGGNISVFVAKVGWQNFREIELELLVRSLMLDGNIVISTGGGVGVNAVNGKRQYELMKEISQTGMLKVVLLTCQVEEIKNRLIQDYQNKVSHRPGVADSKNDSITEKVAADIKLYQSRIVGYKKIGELSGIIVDTTQFDLDMISWEVMANIQ